MSKLFIYLDESGDLGKYGSKFFTVAALSTEKPKPIENMIKRVRHRKMKKSLKELNELKGNNSSDVIRKYVLGKICNMDCSLYIVVITKDQIVNRLFEAKDKLYNYVVGLLIKNIELGSKEIEIIIDKKTNNKLLQLDFNSYLIRRIEERKLLPKINVFHLESHKCRCLQAVDYVAWATNRKYSFDDDSYFKLIEHKVESFEKFWR